MMFKCFRRDDAADPQTFLDAAAAILADYPDDVIVSVTDPRSGIPSKQKWPPQPQEVKSACEEIEGPRRRLREFEEGAKKQLAERAALDAPKPKQTHEEFVKEMIARGMPIGGASKQHLETADTVRSKLGLTKEEWDAIPDSPEPRSRYWEGERRLK